MVKLTVNYQIYRGDINNIEGFVKQINDQINNGWQPYGSPFIIGGDICQAMVGEDYFESSNETARLPGT